LEGTGCRLYFELRQGPAASLYPGFIEAFANQPYFVLAKG
jgi:hypothetical protein